MGAPWRGARVGRSPQQPRRCGWHALASSCPRLPVSKGPPWGGCWTRAAVIHQPRAPPLSPRMVATKIASSPQPCADSSAGRGTAKFRISPTTTHSSASGILTPCGRRGRGARGGAAGLRRRRGVCRARQGCARARAARCLGAGRPARAAQRAPHRESPQQQLAAELRAEPRAAAGLGGRASGGAAPLARRARRERRVRVGRRRPAVAIPSEVAAPVVGADVYRDVLTTLHRAGRERGASPLGVPRASSCGKARGTARAEGRRVATALPEMALLAAGQSEQAPHRAPWPQVTRVGAMTVGSLPFSPSKPRRIPVTRPHRVGDRYMRRWKARRGGAGRGAGPAARRPQALGAAARRAAGGGRVGPAAAGRAPPARPAAGRRRCAPARADVVTGRAAAGSPPPTG
jgi:hypothetical protein